MWPLVWRSEFDNLAALCKQQDDQITDLRGTLAATQNRLEIAVEQLKLEKDAREKDADYFQRSVAGQKAGYQQALDDMAKRLSAAEQRYHELVLKATTVAPSRVEDPQPDAEKRAMHAVSVESKLRLAQSIVDEAAKNGHTIDFDAAFTEATLMLDHPENILLAS